MERSTPHPQPGDAGNNPTGWTAPFFKENLASTVTIHLIKEELKSRKLFNELHWLGFHNCFYQADLLDLIMAALGLKPDSRIQRCLCHDLLQKHSQRIVHDDAELLDEALRVHDVLARHAAFIATQYPQPEPKI